MLLISLSSSHLSNMVKHIDLGGLVESSDPSAFSTWWGGSSLPCFVPPVVGIIPVDSGLVIGYQINEFTCTW